MYSISKPEMKDLCQGADKLKPSIKFNYLKQDSNTKLLELILRSKVVYQKELMIYQPKHCDCGAKLESIIGIDRITLCEEYSSSGKKCIRCYLITFELHCIAIMKNL